MSNIQIIQGDFEKELRLQFAPDIKAGFPSPASDYIHESLDFNRDFIKHPEATFYGRVKGDSMINAGIFAGDIVVIDRALEPSHGDVIVAYLEKEYTIKFLDLSHKDEGYIELVPANDEYEPIRINKLDSFEVWGVVIWTIHDWTKHKR
ncbi:MAG: translesion error-prone DNA polymerase V autoproteolytic subunit [Prevotella sp.]|nr:translesion error-prone DNA polymerase V autoproteolytic subunit [Prevotella sp.]